MTGECYFDGADIEVFVDGTLYQTLFSPFGNFSVTWPSNNTSQNRAGRIVLRYDARCSIGENNGQPDIKTITKDVTIRPDGVPPPRPTVTSTSSSRPTFTASSPGISSYTWSVSNGSISGCNTCSTIRVIPNAGVCSVTATARARGTRCNGTTILSSGRSRTQSIPPPQISGPNTFNVNPQAIINELRFQASNTTSFRYVLSGSSSSGIQFTNTSGNTVTSGSSSILLSCNGANPFSRTLTVTASNSCSSSSRQVTLTCLASADDGPFPVMRDANENQLTSGNELMIYPNTLQKGESLKVTNIPEKTEYLEIISLSTSNVLKIEFDDLKDLELNLDELHEGYYSLRLYGNDGSIETRNLMIKN